MVELERIPLRAEAEKLLEVGAYLAHRMKKMGMGTQQEIRFDLPDFGSARVVLRHSTSTITLEFSEGA